MNSGYAPLLQESHEVEYEMEEFMKKNGGGEEDGVNKAEQMMNLFIGKK